MMVRLSPEFFDALLRASGLDPIIELHLFYVGRVHEWAWGSCLQVANDRR